VRVRKEGWVRMRGEGLREGGGGGVGGEGLDDGGGGGGAQGVRDLLQGVGSAREEGDGEVAVGGVGEDARDAGALVFVSGFLEGERGGGGGGVVRRSCFECVETIKVVNSPAGVWGNVWECLPRAYRVWTCPDYYCQT